MYLYTILKGEYTLSNCTLQCERNPQLPLYLVIFIELLLSVKMWSAAQMWVAIFLSNANHKNYIIS